MSKRYQAAILSVTYNGLLVPNAPTIGTATAGAGSASVTFTAPANVGGGPITSYTVISSPGGIVGTGATSPVTISGLTNGTAYTFTVVATNAYGSGPASAASNSVTPTLNYIEDVFSTWVYTGNDSTQVITNGINLSGRGGLVWIKQRNLGRDNVLYDTARGASNVLFSNFNFAQSSGFGGVSAFSSTGFTLNSAASEANALNGTYASWSFREQANFFDIVTWSGNDVSGRQIAHNLGSTPGMVIIKSLATDDWVVWHRSLTSGNYIVLNSAAAQTTSAAVNRFGNGTTTVDPTATVFTVGNNGTVNQSGNNYVAYLFAHNAGGFGLTGTDNVITCGSYTGNGSATGPVVNLGYEPQWVMIKKSSAEESWYIYDNMRGVVTGAVTAADRKLRANNAGAEGGLTANDPINFGATGFNIGTTDNELNDSGGTYIYVAIRRGPMKPPTTGTSVYNGIARTGTGTTATVSGVGFSPDLFIGQIRNTAGYWNGAVDRLRGVTQRLVTSQTNAEDTTTDAVTSFTMDGVTLGADSNGFVNESGKTYIEWNFKRAPGFFDEVCYTGTGSARTITHNLGVAPELMIVKRRNDIANWTIYLASVGNDKAMNFDDTEPFPDPTGVIWNLTNPTSTVFSIGINSRVNTSGNTYVNYIFASCPGVSKVGSFTGTGATQVINCGFTGGARFVLIKATSTTGNWLVWDSARGIVSGNDPYLALNSTAAEVTNTDWVDTAATGFELSNAGGNLANSNGVSYIFLAIA